MSFYQGLGLYMLVGFFLMMPALKCFASDMKREMTKVGTGMGLSERAVTNIILIASFVSLLTWPMIIITSIIRGIKR